MSRSHGSLVAAARTRPHVASHALLDLVASAPCLSPMPTQTQRAASRQLGPPLSGVEARSLDHAAGRGGESTPVKLSQEWAGSGLADLTLASAWPGSEPGSEGAELSADELRWAEASLELQLQRAALSSRAISGGGTLERSGTPTRFAAPTRHPPALPPRASTAAQGQRRVAPAASRRDGMRRDGMRSCGGATTALPGSRRLGTPPPARGQTERLLVSRRWSMEIVGWGEASRAWLERGPAGTKGILYSSPEAREMLSDRLWGVQVAGERHVGLGA